jgi:hypothetical protein
LTATRSARRRSRPCAELARLAGRAALDTGRHAAARHPSTAHCTGRARRTIRCDHLGSGAAAIQPEQQKPPAELPADVAQFLHRRWLNTVAEQLTATGRQLLTEPDQVAELAAIPIPKRVLSGSDDYAWPVPWQDTMAHRLAAVRASSARSPPSGSESTPERARQEPASRLSV